MPILTMPPTSTNVEQRQDVSMTPFEEITKREFWIRGGI